MVLLTERICLKRRGWSCGAMVLGKLPVPGCPTIWMTVGQGPTALAVGAGGGCLDIFTFIYPFSLSIVETEDRKENGSVAFPNPFTVMKNKTCFHGRVLI